MTYTFRDSIIFWGIVCLLFLLLIGTALCSAAYADASVGPRLHALNTFPLWLKAIRAQEQGNINNPYEITEDFWVDGCRRGGVDWPLVDRYDKVKCGYVIWCYLEHYGYDLHERAAIYNGGPGNRNCGAAQRYADRVMNLVALYEGDGN